MNPRFAACSLLVATALSATGGYAQRLAEKSPFLPPGGKEGPVATENPPLELRGIMGEGAGQLFNIYNPATKTSVWVSLGEAGQNFQIRSFDNAAETVSIDYGGRAVVLKLAQGKIAPLAESRPPPAATTTLPAQPAMAPRPSTPEQVRALESVTAEVERRRALRNQAIRQQQEQQK